MFVHICVKNILIPVLEVILVHIKFILVLWRSHVIVLSLLYGYGSKFTLTLMLRGSWNLMGTPYVFKGYVKHTHASL